MNLPDFETMTKVEIKNLARNPHADPSLLDALFRTRVTDVRRYVAANPNAAEYQLRGWVRSHPVSIRAAIARNPSTPPEALVDLVRDSAERSRRLGEELTNKRRTEGSTPEEGGRVVQLTQAEMEIRIAAGRHCRANADVMALLSQDFVFEVVLIAATSPLTPVKDLHRVRRRFERLITRNPHPHRVGWVDPAEVLEAVRTTLDGR